MLHSKSVTRHRLTVAGCVWLCGPAAVCAAASEAPTQPPPEATVEKICDNLFLLEEAYNQEPGVIQHISVLRAAPDTQAWDYSFTEEWPAPDDRNQLSVTIPLVGAATAEVAIGDLWLNYRYQLVGVGGKGDLAIAPRLSVSIPTGDYRSGVGRGSPGLQANLPLSWDLGPRFTVHFNAGATLTPNARAADAARATALDTSVGAALVWLPTYWLNGFVEAMHVTEAEVAGPQRTTRAQAWVVSPGLRFAVNHASGLQIVPGIASPIELRGEGAHLSVIAYLSFEHPLWTPAAAPASSATAGR